MGNLVQQLQKAVVLMLDNTAVTLTGDAQGSAQEEIGAWESKEQKKVADNPEWFIFRMSSDGLDIHCPDIDCIMYDIPADEIEELNVLFHHDEIESDIATVSANETQYSYCIDQTGNSPENFLLTIYLGEVEDHTTFEYNYPSQQEAEEDVALLQSTFCIDMDKI